ncbi:unnamed protein product [Vitrella brassicaformis CCMP3155]|uniref:Methyltransferase type 11 domain-containing protein n=2 Tax=Vitrella brassicaformis TaxID=1169539 RepID=A0A0G4EYW6_VITBC|nr:unnamed protein product [Vitrella brassicaformis CCMP3155]|eukprot:CEM04269.1 unnamed protein product [Vitrella brassicaformis CCMP3155]
MGSLGWAAALSLLAAWRTVSASSSLHRSTRHSPLFIASSAQPPRLRNGLDTAPPSIRRRPNARQLRMVSAAKVAETATKVAESASAGTEVVKVAEKASTLSKVAETATKVAESASKVAGDASKVAVKVAEKAATFSKTPAGMGVAAGVAALAAGVAVKKVLDTPSRPYDRAEGSVAREYDAWTEEGILEHYWGEHVHLGYYDDEDRRKGSWRKDFKQAKDDFVLKMLEFAKVDVFNPPKDTLDLGCGIGGTARILAKAFGPQSRILGIAISPNQIARANELATEQGVSDSCKFMVMDGMKMTVPDNTFDFVWVCESTEHMPDKQKAIQEMTRVLKPGGRLVVAVWSQRDDTDKPFTKRERRRLDYLYSEWSHPFFTSVPQFVEMLQDTGVMENIETADWAQQTLPSWRHQIWLGIKDPLPWLTKPKFYWKCVRDAWCLNRMHQAFKEGLMQYGMITATKKAV